VLARREDGLSRPLESQEAGGWDLWAAEQLGALLAAAPTLPARLTQDAGPAALEAFIHARCGSGPGVLSQFARHVGLHMNLLCHWRKGRALPTIDLVLRVCHALGVSPVAFFLGDPCRLASTPCRAVGQAPRRTARRAPTLYDGEELRQGALTLLANTGAAPLSVAETARRLGCPSAVLLRLCPDVYHLIAERHRASRAHQREERVQQLTAEMRHVMHQFTSTGIYPAAKRVRARLQRRIHPRNSDFNRIRHQLLLEFGWNSDGTRLTANPLVVQD
jgi:transcriptional regulator with XRE-family HTH domain